MAILDFFRRRRPASASVAKERLQIILSHERAHRSAPEFLPALQQDIIRAVGKYLPIDPERVTVQFDQREACAVLELNIALPPESASAPKLVAPALAPAPATAPRELHKQQYFKSRKRR
jgi:cell division topological specificity factor